jgi:hypothetical protein
MNPNPARFEDAKTLRPPLHDCALPIGGAVHARYGAVAVSNFMGRCNGCAGVIHDGEYIITNEAELRFILNNPTENIP